MTQLAQNEIYSYFYFSCKGDSKITIVCLSEINPPNSFISMIPSHHPHYHHHNPQHNLQDFHLFILRLLSFSACQTLTDRWTNMDEWTQISVAFVTQYLVQNLGLWHYTSLKMQHSPPTTASWW